MLRVKYSAGNRFGFALTFHERYIAVGCPGDSTSKPSQGSVYMFRLEPADVNGPILEIGKLTNTDVTEDSRYGGVSCATAISDRCYPAEWVQHWWCPTPTCWWGHPRTTISMYVVARRAKFHAEICDCRACWCSTKGTRCFRSNRPHLTRQAAAT